MATLKSHWRFNNGLGDSTGDFPIINLNGTTPKYTENKDGVENAAALSDNTWYGWSNLITGDNRDEYAVSLWIRRGSGIVDSSIFSDGCHFIRNGLSDSTLIITLISTASPISVTIPAGIGSTDWFHLVYKVDNISRIRKVFINGILLAYDTSIFYLPTTNKYFSVNCNYVTSVSRTGNARYIDEVKYFEGVLSDGDVTLLGQQATGEVLELYLAGVNNISPPILNPATNITSSTADISWT